jgi:hypothetical protein
MPANPIHSVPHLPRWYRGPMVVIGDAAHALPVILRLTANSKQVNQQYRYHIDWDTLISSTAA